MARAIQIATEEDSSQELLWVAIQSFLTAVANISKALWGQGGSLSAEREPLRLSLHVDDSSPIKATSMRNNFDHFDDRLDTWWATSKNHLHFDYLVAPGWSVGGMDATDVFRWYDPETTEVIFWGDKYPLATILAEVVRIGEIAEIEASKPY